MTGDVVEAGRADGQGAQLNAFRQPVRISGEPMLEIRDLYVDFAFSDRVVHAVRGLSISVGRGESLGIVGESGSGKSVTALSILGLVRHQQGCTMRGSIKFEGQELLALREKEFREIRGRRIGVVFQDPLSSLNPALTVGRQITEVLESHDVARGRDASIRSIELLELVGIPDPGRRVRQYPHELSGGLRQRAMIAVALACSPSLLIADEPTTALDVTIQAQILELLQQLRERLGMSLLLVTHNLGVVAHFAERVAIMYGGRVLEVGSTRAVLGAPSHPYTQALLHSLPRLDQPPRSSLVPISGVPLDPAAEPRGCAFAPRCAYAIADCVLEPPPLNRVGTTQFSACWVASDTETLSEPRARADIRQSEVRDASHEAEFQAIQPVLEVRDLKVWFPVKRGLTRKAEAWLRAVDGVTFSLNKGETVALVGESGCGKTTTARAVVRANQPREGAIFLGDVDLLRLHSPSELRPYRRQLQMVFQDPYSSLDPRRTVGHILAEPMRIHEVAVGAEQRERIARLLVLVGLTPSAVARYPHEFSGGQRQRIAIARALASVPDVVVCDEPISALDVSIQAQIVNLLRDLQRDLGIAYLFISHDLAVVRHLAHRVAVMYLGRIVEMGESGHIYGHPSHPYTAALLSAVPVPDVSADPRQRRVVLVGDVPSPVTPPPGCPFHPRCPLRRVLGNPQECSSVAPKLVERNACQGTHVVACHFSGEMKARHKTVSSVSESNTMATNSEMNW